ncbi:MAG: biotin carboxylase N-terminal domain-containing protein [Wenzhouxiangellaceae bacterium]|nr:biotin carboxylase N-terminal domain-containing protein [Wenzhouxiangellaceae bacterium]
MKNGELFSRILIANRGEIACRIIDSCRRLGIETVAVYSDADADARHVKKADRAIAIGPAEARRSYLDVEKIIQAARDSGSQAVHPGYGFLSENADFARKLQSAGIVLVGPRPETIEAMGSKALAKAIMQDAGIPLVPGYHGDDQNDATLAAQAGKVGFPIMLKAASGGGGKGMRIVRATGDFLDALAAARREAAAAFGDERMIIERYVECPRHIEAQVFGDSHGNVVHLFERDCSSQRRHQKVIEEAPAANLDPDTRRQLLEAAVRAAQAVNYVGAGTVEFLVDQQGFYFLEMNTRLQVEHPVTECVTGQDLVEWQLRVAAGQALPCTQDEIVCRGHAMEARIYAEDPDSGFLPVSGTISQLDFPDRPWARIDSGVDNGDTVSVHYDPMVAKLIVSGENRTVCRARLKAALAHCHIAGLTTNLGFLLQLAASEVFTTATIDTGLLDRALDELLDHSAQPPVEILAAACGVFLSRPEASVRTSSRSPWDTLDGWRIGGTASQKLDLEISGQRIELECTADGRGGFSFQHQGDRHQARARFGKDDVCSLTLDGETRRLVVHGDDIKLEIIGADRRWSVLRHRRFEALEAISEGSGRMLAPMPGKVIQIAVAEGDSVVEGQTLALMEAMKMELSIKSDVAGHVRSIHTVEGELVEAEFVLLEIEPD